MYVNFMINYFYLKSKKNYLLEKYLDSRFPQNSLRSLHPLDQLLVYLDRLHNLQEFVRDHRRRQLNGHLDLVCPTGFANDELQPMNRDTVNKNI